MKKKVLLIDDEADLRGIFKIFLVNLGNIDFFEAGDGKEGIKVALEVVPDIIIIDYKMPEMNGLEAIKVLKQEEKIKAIPIILYTGYANDIDADTALAAGCSEILYKPINTTTWIEKINRYLA